MATGSTPVIIKAGPCGTPFGAAVPMDVTGVTRIVRIAIWEDSYINGFSIDFERNGSRNSFQLGTVRGTPTSEIILQPSEYIKSVKGRLGDNSSNQVRSLIFVTNLDIYGPYGSRSGGINYELAAINTETIKGEIIGFHGSVGTRVDSIGVYIKVSNITGGGSGADKIGGAATGGNASGGAATAGSATGGSAKGDATSTGGAATGGSAKGEWISTGGDATGGDAVGNNSSTGGNATGGEATGGNAAGGNASGGNATGGGATGGTAVGGDATGAWSGVGGTAVGGNAE